MDNCKICAKPCNLHDNLIVCDICKLQLHVNCTNLTEAQFAELTSTSVPYFCHISIAESLPVNLDASDIDGNSNYPLQNSGDCGLPCDYYDQQLLNDLLKMNGVTKPWILHLNIRSLGKHIDKLVALLAQMHNPPHCCVRDQN